MWQDIVDLNAFYASPLGQVARRIIRRRIRALWPNLSGQSVLGLGFATPYLRPFKGEAARVLAILPDTPGGVGWPPRAAPRGRRAGRGAAPPPPTCAGNRWAGAAPSRGFPGSSAPKRGGGWVRLVHR